jgi:endonuclease V-like protein UPF0215 family
MKDVEEILRLGKRIRSIGVDDAPFARGQSDPVHISGVVCANTRFEGLLCGRVQQDGLDATESIDALIQGSKFYEQLHLVLLDGISFGGLNLVDLPALAQRLGLPCVAVMRRWPDLDGFHRALGHLPDAEERAKRQRRAGAIHTDRGFVFQCSGIEPGVAGRALAALTDVGAVPEPLRLAHLISAAIETGQSGRRA